jgi:hypothetical protein
MGASFSPHSCSNGVKETVTFLGVKGTGVAVQGGFSAGSKTSHLIKSSSKASSPWSSLSSNSTMFSDSRSLVSTACGGVPVSMASARGRFPYGCLVLGTNE